VLVLSMVLVSAGSITIASSEFNAQQSEYEAYVDQVRAAGGTVLAPPPGLYPLNLLRPVIEYIEIIGAVLAIGLGYLSVARERRGRTLPLLHTRPIHGRTVFAGRLLGAAALIATVVAAAAVISVVVLGIAGGRWLNGSEIVKLTVSFASGVLYMLLFYALATWITARSRVLANGLVVALVIWLSLVLIVPQIGDTMDPDNQVPGGLFAALNVNKADEHRVLAHFSGYERVRNLLEETSLSKHFERFTFAMTGIKDGYNDRQLGDIIHRKRNDVAWLVFYAALMSVLMWSALARRRSAMKEA
jgi:ABC-type transport system involved in multi-copper enzyme maturation permease subunit